MTNEPETEACMSIWDVPQIEIDRLAIARRVYVEHAKADRGIIDPDWEREVVSGKADATHGVRIASRAIEAAARAIASELGFEYDLMLASKSEWIDKRGVDGTGQFRDVNDPFRCDIAAAARAAVIAFLRAYVPNYDAAVACATGNPRDVLEVIADELGASHDAP